MCSAKACPVLPYFLSALNQPDAVLQRTFPQTGNGYCHTNQCSVRIERTQARLSDCKMELTAAERSGILPKHIFSLTGRLIRSCHCKCFSSWEYRRYNGNMLPALETYIKEQVSEVSSHFPAWHGAFSACLSWRSEAWVHALHTECECHVQSNDYSQSANLALLRIYAIYPEKRSIQTLSQLLMKAITRLPSTDFNTLLHLIPEKLQAGFCADPAPILMCPPCRQTRTSGKFLDLALH